MTGRKDQRLSLFRVIVLALVSALPSAAHASEKTSPALLLGGSFEQPPIHRFLPGSKKTILFPAQIGRLGEITPLDATTGWGSGSWDRFLTQARERSGLLLATLDPVIVRDARGVVQMAIISTDDPMTASCILTPRFLRRFSAIFGPEIIVAVPTKSRIYIFPKLANRIAAMSQNIRDDYLISPAPVSTELFEISKKGIRAVGETEPDR